jgi:GlpG protein
MRCIGQVLGREHARTLNNFLLFEGIANQMEEEAHEAFQVWIHAEEDVERARSILSAYLAHPNDPRFVVGEVKPERSRPTRVYDRTNLFKSSASFGLGPVTMIFIAICVTLYILVDYAGWEDLGRKLLMSSLVSNNPMVELQDILHGEVWRLFTPVLLHGSIPHILFNMFAFKDLGSVIEARFSSLRLLLMIVSIGVFSNLVQFVWAGPSFLGMSGVIYGLFGYIWMRARHDPTSGLFVPTRLVTMMLVWFFICWLPGMNVANGAHAGGLVIGVVWGYLGSKMT